jgi:hypothetical protein
MNAEGSRSRFPRKEDRDKLSENRVSNGTLDQARLYAAKSRSPCHHPQQANSIILKVKLSSVLMEPDASCCKNKPFQQA